MPPLFLNIYVYQLRPKVVHNDKRGIVRHAQYLFVSLRYIPQSCGALHSNLKANGFFLLRTQYSIPSRFCNTPFGVFLSAVVRRPCALFFLHLTLQTHKVACFSHGNRGRWTVFVCLNNFFVKIARIVSRCAQRWVHQIRLTGTNSAVAAILIQ